MPFTAGVATASDAPLLRNPATQIDKPDLSGLQRLRFLTTLDFPPFNFADATKRPTGFNVELARAICQELDIVAKCEVQALPWDELEPALASGRGEAIIAGTAVTAQKRAQFAMTPSYFRFPARFIALKQTGLSIDQPSSLAGKSVAVVEGSAHAAMLEAHFPQATPLPLLDDAAARRALADGEADLLFGDGVSLGFYLVSTAAQNCCDFVGGPYYDARFLGEGMGIVLRKADSRLLLAVEAALIETKRSGVYFDILARYFPRDPYAD
ncbi:MAG: transporter substrate-binding domain-containing protein [Ahrensia sp.]